MRKGELKQLALAVITQNRDGALATVDSKGVPHVATIYCLADDNFTLTFITRMESRKFKNISFNSMVALAFWNEKTLATVQLTGNVTRVDDLEKEQELMYKLLTLRFHEKNWPNPPMQMYERGASRELAVLQVTPSELTYATFETKPNGRYQPFFHKVI